MPQADAALRHVFVYGTLRAGQSNDINRLQPAPAFVANSKINGTLYDLGNYPGMRLGGLQWVQGEVYQISRELERQLDEIEEVWPQQTGEYERREVVVQCSGLALTCLVYEIAQMRISDRVVMGSGDWAPALTQFDFEFVVFERLRPYHLRSGGGFEIRVRRFFSGERFLCFQGPPRFVRHAAHRDPRLFDSLAV